MSPVRFFFFPFFFLLFFLPLQLSGRIRSSLEPCPSPENLGLWALTGVLILLGVFLIIIFYERPWSWTAPSPQIVIGQSPSKRLKLGRYIACGS